MSTRVDTVGPRYNDIPNITIKILYHGKSHSKIYGTEPWHNDLRYNDNPEITMWIWRTERKILPDIKILFLIVSIWSANTNYKQQRFIEFQ